MNELETADTIEISTTNHPITLMPIFSGVAFLQLVQYPIIVEMWDKIVGRETGGRRKRAWLTQFSEADRRLLSHWHQRFYRWHLVTGTPQRIIMRLSTLEVLQRAVHFFATC